MFRIMLSIVIVLLSVSLSAADTGGKLSLDPAACRGLPSWIPNPSAKASVAAYRNGLLFSVPEAGKAYRWEIKGNADLRTFSSVRIRYRMSGVDRKNYIVYIETQGKQKFYPLHAKESKCVIDNSLDGETHALTVKLNEKTPFADNAVVKSIVIGVDALSDAQLYIESIEFISDAASSASAADGMIRMASVNYTDAFSFVPDKALAVTAAAGWDNDAVRGSALTVPSDENVLHNGGFESVNEGRLDGWRYELVDGAEGSVAWDKSCSRSGARSLRISKLNDRGYILVYSERPIACAPGDEVSFQGFYHARDNAYPHHSLAMVRLGAQGDINYDQSLDKWDGFTTQQRIVNARTGQWHKRIVSRKISPKGEDVVVHFIVYGSPAVLWWDDCAVGPAAKARKRWDAAYPISIDFPKADMIPESRLNALLSADRDHTARLVLTNERSVIFIDGVPAVPVIFKEGVISPMNPAGAFVNPYGVNLQMQTICFGDIRIEDDPRENGVRNLAVLPGVLSGKDAYNFDTAVDILRRTLRASPDAYLLIDLRLSFYKDYVADNPDTAWVNEKGQKAYGLNYLVVGYTDTLPAEHYRWWPSHYAKKWQDDTMRGAVLLIDRLKKEGLLKRVIGFHLSGGHDNQFAPSRVDHSTHALAAYRAFLKEKYGTADGLRKAWNKPADLDTVSYPSGIDDRIRFLDPARHTDWYDYWQFTQTSLFRIQEMFARAIRSALGKEVIVFKYLMAQHGGAYNGGWTQDLLSRSDVFDAVTPQPAYTKRDPGVSTRFNVALLSYNLNNKMVVGEFDIRTYLRNRKDELYTAKLGRMESFAMWQSGLRKLTGPMIADGGGYYYFDIDWGFYQGDVARDIGEDKKVYERELSLLLSRPRMNPKQMLVVLDEDSLYWTALAAKRYMYEIDVANKGEIDCLANSGVPFDYVIMEDLIKFPELIDRYKVFVFTTSFRVDAPRKKLYDSLKSKGRTLVWMNAAGYVNETSASAENIKLLTGFVVTEGGTFSAVLPVPGKDLAGVQDLFSIERASKLLQGTDSYYDFPGLAIDDPSAEVLAVFEGSMKGAVAVKEFPGWTSVYAASPGGISPGLINRICRQKGAYVVTRPGLDIALNNDFMSVHGVVPGYYTLTLPRKCTVKNLKDGSVIAQGTDRIQIWIEPQTTYWFGLE